MDWKRLITVGIGGRVFTVAVHANMVSVSRLDAVSRKAKDSHPFMVTETAYCP